jgi:UDP-N-acetyl-2-amino-2-deoxyglucuronate dehydrogenase
MLMWIFGDVEEIQLSQMDDDHASGTLSLLRAKVDWFLSINYDHLPDGVKNAGKRTFRTLTMEGEAVEFSDGFTDLHTKSYEEILKGNGFGLEDAKASIDLAYKIRNLSQGE